jgi:hypothetical protein
MFFKQKALFAKNLQKELVGKDVTADDGCPVTFYLPYCCLFNVSLSKDF